MRGRSQPVGEKCKPKIHILMTFLSAPKLVLEKSMKLSQKQLGNHLDITFQQIPKYEKGINHISAERLQEIATLLDVPISFFYVDILTEEKVHTLQNDEIPNKTEDFLLKNFRVLSSKNRKQSCS